MSNVKSYEELAEVAYLAWIKAKAAERAGAAHGFYVVWGHMPPAQQATWIAVARQLWAEFAAMH